MAAAAIIGGISVASAVAPLIPQVISYFERLFPKGTGAAKLDAGVNVITTIAQALGKAGIVNEAPDPAKITTQIQAVVDSEKLPGGLLSANPTVAGSVAPMVPYFPPGVGLMLTGVGQLLASLETQK